MKKISSLSIVKEAFTLFFGRLSYIVKQLYPQFIFMYGTVFYLASQFNAFQQNPSYYIETFSVFKMIALFVLGLVFIVTYINYTLYITQMGVNQKIETTKLMGFGIECIQLRALGTILILTFGTISVVLLALVFSSILNSPSLIVNFGLLAVACIPVFYMFLKLYFLFPAIVSKKNMGFVESWNISKGRLMTIFGIIFFLGLISSVVSLIISLPDIINAFKGVQPAEPNLSILNLFITVTFHLVSIGIGSLAPAILYRKIKT